MNKEKIRQLLKKKQKNFQEKKVMYLTEIRESEPELITSKTKSEIIESVKYLMSLPQHEQRTESWYTARKLLITASEAAAVLFKTYSCTKNYIDFYQLTDFIIAPNKGCNPYMNINEFYLKKCGLIPFTGNIATRHGQKYEDVAISVYANLFEKEILEFGLIQHPSFNWLGASPDGISTDGIMLEIKCPFKRKITGIAPFYYWVQVQLQLEVCNLEYCDFLECIFDRNFEWSTEKEFLEESETGINKNEIFNQFGPNKKEFDGNTLKKGLIVLQRPRKEKGYEFDSFYYPPIGLTDPQKLLDWAENKIKKVKAALTIQNAWIYYKTGKYLHNYYIKPLFWKLTDIHVSRIVRDQDWFNSNKHHFIDAHNKMKWYQQNGTDSIPRKKKRKSPKNQQKITPLTHCLIKE